MKIETSRRLHLFLLFVPQISACALSPGESLLLAEIVCLFVA